MQLFRWLALAGLSSFAFGQTPATPTNIVMYTAGSTACAWSAPLPSIGSHTFSVTDGVTTTTVHGYVVNRDPRFPVILVYYTPITTGSCPALTLLQ